MQYMDCLYHDLGGQDLDGGALLSRIEEGEEKKAGIMAGGKVGIVLEHSTAVLCSVIIILSIGFQQKYIGSNKKGYYS